MAATTPSHAQVETRWDEELVKVEETLREGRWRRGLRQAERLVEQIVERQGSFEQSARPLATAVTYLALGEAGEGEREAAAWHWTAARSLYPRIRRLDLESFGAPGRYLLEVPLRLAGTIPEELGGSGGVGRDATWISPVEIDTGRDQFCGRYAATRDDNPAGIMMEVVILPDGSIHQPVLHTQPDRPAIAWAAMECLRGRRYRPEEGELTVPALGRVQMVFEGFS